MSGAAGPLVGRTALASTPLQWLTTTLVLLSSTICAVAIGTDLSSTTWDFPPAEAQGSPSTTTLDLTTLMTRAADTSTNLGVRLRAISLIADLEDAEAAEALLDLWAAPQDPAVRFVLVSLLDRRPRTPTRLALLRSLKSDRSAAVRAVSALGLRHWSGDTETADALRDAATADASVAVRDCARRALGSGPRRSPSRAGR